MPHNLTSRHSGRLLCVCRRNEGLLADVAKVGKHQQQVVYVREAIAGGVAHARRIHAPKSLLNSSTSVTETWPSPSRSPGTRSSCTRTIRRRWWRRHCSCKRCCRCSRSTTSGRTSRHRWWLMDHRHAALLVMHAGVLAIHRFLWRLHRNCKPLTCSARNSRVVPRRDR